MHTIGPLRELHLGVVTDNEDAEHRGRLRVRLHALDMELWAPALAPSAGQGYGVSFLPKVGEQVVVGFLSPDLPVVLGALWSGAAAQPDDARPVEDRYLLRTPEGTEVLCDDAEGPRIRISTRSGYHLTVDERDGGTITVEKGPEKVELTASGITINTSGKVEVNASQVSVSAAMVQVDAAMSRFSGVVQCDTLLSNAVVSASYTPGAGNIW